jgi:hypothetical protein
MHMMASLSPTTKRELIRQAFAAWEIVIAMDFLEAQQPNDAQIIFGIGQDENNKNKTMNGRRGKTGGTCKQLH